MIHLNCHDPGWMDGYMIKHTDLYYLLTYCLSPSTDAESTTNGEPQIAGNIRQGACFSSHDRTDGRNPGSWAAALPFISRLRLWDLIFVGGTIISCLVLGSTSISLLGTE